LHPRVEQGTFENKRFGRLCAVIVFHIHMLSRVAPPHAVPAVVPKVYYAGSKSQECPQWIIVTLGCARIAILEAMRPQDELVQAAV
jgi:hypothetical protein